MSQKSPVRLSFFYIFSSRKRKLMKSVEILSAARKIAFPAGILFLVSNKCLNFSGKNSFPFPNGMTRGPGLK